MKRFFARTAVVLLVAVLVGGLSLFSASKDEVKPYVIKGAEVKIVSGTLIHWKDLKKVDLSKVAKRRMKPVMNFKDPRKLTNKTKDHLTDPVAQTGVEQKGLEKSALAVTTGTHFAGMNQSANGAGWPPDTNGDVGPTYFIQTVNTSIGIYNKSTGALVSATTFDAFFPSGVGAPCAASNNGDPIVLYDRYNSRWFILDFAWTDSGGGASYYSIAASQTSNPTGSWYTYCFQADSTLMNDYPKCGVWHDGIYITANMFAWGGSYQHAKMWAIKTPDLYSGTLTSQNVTDSGSKAWSIMPSSAKSPTGPASSSPNFMYSIDADEFSGGVDALFVWKYKVNWTTPSSTTWTGPSQMNVAAYGLSGSGVPQQGTSNTLDSLYGRLMFPANYWNFGTHESVVLSHVCEYSSRRAMRWYEVRINSSDVSSIYQQGTYSPDSTHRWMGAVAINANGDIGMGYSASSSSLYPSIRVTGRNSSDTLGTMQAETTMVSGTGSQTSYSRWGDYSSCFVDPDDSTTFWYTQEYYTSNGTNWQTRIGSFTLGGSPPTCSLNDAVDNATITLTSSDWACDQTTSCDSVDSAKSGTITHNGTSSMQFTRTFAANEGVQFKWSVSSEANYDYLRVYVDGVEESGAISGTVTCQTKTVCPGSGSHTIKWSYTKDGSVSTGSDAGWVDQVTIVTSCSGGGCTDTIAVALDDVDCNTYSNSGNYLWEVTTADSHAGGSSMKSPAALGDNQSSTIQTTISGYSSISFWWKVSSEANYDYLEFYIDSVRQDRIAGTVAWQQKNYTISTGSHTIKWVYDKDYSVSSGSDCGWVDDVAYGTGGGGPTYCTASGNNYSYEWISRVQVGTINNSSGASGYTDFTSVTGNLTRGNSASVTLTPGFSGSTYTEYWRIWIDYNQDGDFDDSGETVFSGTGSSVVSGSFTVSSGAATGNTRMRVIMKYSGYAPSCGTFTYGEVEDYTVDIQ